mmetsp:Transcript_7515/g.12692  ORF Transcript_7515/g.12692 Transcript_7515/m.12692 type:complete len:285 (-) Transcript_7515:562-1416(-)
MLSVEAVLDPLRFVDLVQDPVSVVLHGCREDDHFVELSHLSQKFVAARPHQEGALATHFEVVDQGLIQVEYQAVARAALHGRQVGSVGRGQGLVATDRCSSDAVERGEVGVLLELLDLLAGLDDVVPGHVGRRRVNVLERLVDHRVEWAEGGPSHHRALEQPLVPHLNHALGRHVGAGPGLLPLADDALEDVDDLLVHVAHGHLGDVLALRLLLLGLDRVLEVGDDVAGHLLVGQLGDYYLDSADEVLLDEAEQVLDLLDLEVGRLEHVGRAGVVVDDGDRENL